MDTGMIEPMIGEVRRTITDRSSLEQSLEVLVKYKLRGVSQAAMKNALVELRVSCREWEEDRVLELLDCVVGFCAPHLCLWSE